MEIILARPKKSTINDIPEKYETRFKAASLNTALNPTFGIKTSKHFSDNIEGFLPALEGIPINEAFQSQHFGFPNKKTREIQGVLLKLKNMDPSMLLQKKSTPLV